MEVRNKIIVGVDIGISGAVVIYTPESGISVLDMPILKLPVLDKKGRPMGKKTKTIYDISKIVHIFKDLLPDHRNCVVFIEKAQILPHGFTIKGNVGVARCQALFEGVLTTLGIEYEIINPKTWQLYFGIETKKDNKGKVIEDTKEQSVKKTKELYPQIILETKRGRILDGRADAILITEYGRRKLEGQII